MPLKVIMITMDDAANGNESKELQQQAKKLKTPDAHVSRQTTLNSSVVAESITVL